MNKIEIITQLMSIDYKIVLITNPISKEEEIFIFNIFTPSDNLSHKHYIKGKDITKIFDNQSHLFLNYNNQNSSLKIEFEKTLDTLPLISREYSSSYLWTSFISR